MTTRVVVTVVVRRRGVGWRRCGARRRREGFGWTPRRARDERDGRAGRVGRMRGRKRRTGNRGW